MQLPVKKFIGKDIMTGQFFGWNLRYPGISHIISTSAPLSFVHEFARHKILPLYGMPTSAYSPAIIDITLNLGRRLSECKEKNISATTRKEYLDTAIVLFHGAYRKTRTHKDRVNKQRLCEELLRACLQSFKF